MSYFLFQKHSLFPTEYEICQKTGLLKYKLSKKRKYSDSYFNEEYKSQYKRTYYEDEKNIRFLAKKRLTVLQSFLPKKKDLSLFEIGCASGFFLDEARKKNFQVSGLEISSTEVNYAKNLGLLVEKGNFLNFSSKQQFDVICAFFVLEHIEHIELLFQKIDKMTKKKSLLFLALPSIQGPTFQTNIQEWFETHPKDHFFDYGPMSLRKILQLYNFEILYQKPMSYHRERDRGWKGKILNDYCYKLYADFFCYGDTMEVLCRKK